MTQHRLYTVVLRAEAQEQTEQSLSRDLNLQGLLDGGSTATPLTSDPDQISVNATVVGTKAGQIATELNELSTAGDFDTVPFFVKSGSSDRDGYYTLESVDDSPGATWTADSARELRLSMRRDGTHETRWSAVETERFQADHSFGNDTVPIIGIPATAAKVRWYNPETGSLAPASPTATVTAEYGDIDRYNLDDGDTAVSTKNPTLLYDLSYGETAVVDPVVWDDRGNAAKIDADGVRQWQHVFATSHEYQGRPILDTGRLRVTVDEPNGVLEAETWDTGTSSWSAVGLDWSGDWSVFDADLTTISPARIRGQFTFENASTGELYALDGVLARGAVDVLWHIPDNETSPIPSGLETVLGPIASTRIVGAQPGQTLVAREEVRR